ncbi:MAG TPA: hypothetical protein VF595_05760 [Tepidisphaeraceae bacterium]|jgi:hypothetical protein
MGRVSLAWVCAACVTAGCSRYATPGGPAPIAALRQTDSYLQSSYEAKPLATFPAFIAIARVQGNDYKSRTAQSYGHGAFRIVTTRDVESDAAIGRLNALPGVRGLAPLNRMLVPLNLQSEDDLRRAAARLKSDMLLMYTFDTQFYVKDFAAPVTLISLGLSPNRRAYVTTTASAVLIDTRSGFVYGGAEATAKSDQLANGWTSEDAIDDTRLRTEKETFEKLVGELEKAWPDVVKQHAQPATQPQP